MSSESVNLTVDAKPELVIDAPKTDCEKRFDYTVFIDEKDRDKFPPPTVCEAYKRLFILRRDLKMSTGKLLAMFGHECEAYWTSLFRAVPQHQRMRFEDGTMFRIDIDNGTLDGYVNGIFTKTVCEAKNLNQLLKAKTIALELGLVEGKDFGLINDCCKTELTPENEDGTCTVGIWFKPLPFSVTDKISRKFKLFGFTDSHRKPTNFQHYGDFDAAVAAYKRINGLGKDEFKEGFGQWLFAPYDPEQDKPRKDKDTLDYFRKLKDDTSLTWTERLTKMIDWEKEHNGLIGISPPFVMPSEDGKVLTKEDIARDMFLLKYGIDSGEIECEDVTEKVLNGEEY